MFTNNNSRQKNKYKFICPKRLTTKVVQYGYILLKIDVLLIWLYTPQDRCPVNLAIYSSRQMSC